MHSEARQFVSSASAGNDPGPWAPESTSYAPADVLFEHLRLGWTLEGLVVVEVVYRGGYRRLPLYRFTVERGGESLEIAVVATPTILQLVRERNLTRVWLEHYERVPRWV